MPRVRQFSSTKKTFNLVKLRIDEQMRLLMVSEKVAVVSQEMSSRNHRCPGVCEQFVGGFGVCFTFKENWS